MSEIMYFLADTLDTPVFWGLFSAAFWGLFLFSFHRDRSRYRNCYLLFAALVSLGPFILMVSRPNHRMVLMVIIDLIMMSLLIVPFFLIFNGVVMIRKEGRHLSQLLSLGLGVAILLGEAAVVSQLMGPYLAGEDMSAQPWFTSAFFVTEAVFSVSVIYGSMCFLIFMLYVLFLQIIPRKKDFDYVIIHGAGLLDGNRVSRLLQDRLDKAIEVYLSDPSPTKLVPSGGQGKDEIVSEARAMKDYLLSRGIPESDIIMEDKSTTTLENLRFSKEILDAREGRKYTALVSSNYHVYRALRYCRKIGLKCTGIGSHVAFYYWPSAMIREFIAIHTEKKHAITFLLGWALCVAALLMIML